jgi:hypothetical protein
VSHESGFAGGLEAIAFGLLVFFAGSLLFVNAWAVVDANLAASAAAREAVRAVVESTGSEADAFADGASAGMAAIEGEGKDPDRADLAWSGGLARCETITATVSYSVPTMVVPWLHVFGSVIRTSAHHSEIVDPYRGGLPAEGFRPETCGA